MRDDLAAYIAYHAATDWSQATVSSNRYRLGRFADWLEQRGIIRWADVTAADLDAFQHGLLAQGLAYGTRVGYIWLVRVLFDWLAQRGKVLVNPGVDLAAFDDGERALPPAPLSEEQVTRLFQLLPGTDAVDLRNRLHVELLYGCALRLSESINLDLTDLDFRERTLLVRGGKGDKDRQVPMMGGVLAAAKDYLAVRRELLVGPDHGVLLLSKDGQRLEEKVIQRVLKRVGRVMGIRIHPHLLRHSLAVHLLRQDVDIRLIQEILGHALLDTTKIYLRLVPGHLKEDYDKAMPPIALQPPPVAGEPAPG